MCCWHLCVPPMSFLCVYLDLMWRRVIGTVFFFLGQPFRSLSLDLKADGCHWHPKSHVLLVLPLGCIKNFRIGTALGTVSHELINHISTSSGSLQKHTWAKARLWFIHHVWLWYTSKACTGLPEAFPNFHQTFSKPSPNLPKEFQPFLYSPHAPKLPQIIS